MLNDHEYHLGTELSDSTFSETRWQSTHMYWNTGSLWRVTQGLGAQTMF